jgi:hypothetical protein
MAGMAFTVKPAAGFLEGRPTTSSRQICSYFINGISLVFQLVFIRGFPILCKNIIIGAIYIFNRVLYNIIEIDFFSMFFKIIYEFWNMPLWIIKVYKNNGASIIEHRSHSTQYR